MSGEGYVDVCETCFDAYEIESPYGEIVPCPSCCPDEHDRAVGFGELSR